MTYEYICVACAYEWEEDQSIKDKPIKICPSCKEKKAKRLISKGGSFILKGGGWAATGYGG